MYPLLNKIDSPSDLKKLELEQLPQVCSELRDYLLNTISQTSGHLASNLGAVELTVAIHYVYQTPFDQLIWDVGHQAYPHKILTGRRDALKSIRKKNGLHPFPWREESPYDSLSVGHSSTSISAGLGMAIAAKRENLNRKIVSVIGDGAITAGLAFEALNHAGDVRPDMLVILNDNDMSISENVGALSKHMAQILSGEFYTNIRECSKKMLANTPTLKDIAQKTEEHLKGMIGPGTLFEELGFNYIGPIDGHDVILLVKTLTNMRNNLTGPQFLHISTTKGKGYSPAELDPTSYHGVPKFNLHTNSLPKSCSKYPTYSQVFGQWLVDMATVDPSLVAITPAMREGSGMVEFSKRYPDRFFDVAIAEQHAVTIATGLAIGGLKPVIAIYSSFLQRAYDQVIHDIALMNLSVLFAIDRAGIVGADGPTHQGAFDISFLRCIPNLIIMTPSDENECRQMLYTGHQYHGPACVRYPRGSGACCSIEHTFTQFEIGVANKIKTGSSIAILNFGSRLKSAKIAAKNLNATLVDMRFVKPLDKTMILELATSHKYLVTIEENAIMGGAGSGVNELLMAHKVLVPVLNLGLPDEFIAQGGQEEINRDCNLDAYGIETEITNYIGQ